MPHTLSSLDEKRTLTPTVFIYSSVFFFFFQLKAFFLSSVLSSPLSLVFQMHLISNSYFCLLVSSYTGHFLYLRVKSSRLSGEASVQSPALPLTVSAGDCQVSE